MELHELAGQMNNQHRETQARLISLDDKIVDVRERVIKIESTHQDKETCETHRAEFHEKMNKRGIANKVMAFLGGVVGGAIAVLTFGYFGGGK